MCRLPVVLGSIWIIDGQMELWLSVWLQYCARKKFPVHKEQKKPPSLLMQELYNPLSGSCCSFKPAFMRQTNSHDGLQPFHPVGARFCSLKVAISPRMPGISPFMQHTFDRFPLWWVNIFIYQGKYSHTHAISLNNPSHQLKPKADESPLLLLGASKTPEIFF